MNSLKTKWLLQKMDPEETNLLEKSENVFHDLDRWTKFVNRALAEWNYVKQLYWNTTKSTIVVEFYYRCRAYALSFERDKLHMHTSMKA